MQFTNIEVLLLCIIIQRFILVILFNGKDEIPHWESSQKQVL